MKPPLYKFQQEAANKIATKLRVSQTAVISIPTGYGRAAILHEVARQLETPYPILTEWDQHAYQLAWFKYFAAKEVKECQRVGNKEAMKLRKQRNAWSTKNKEI